MNDEAPAFAQLRRGKRMTNDEPPSAIIFHDLIIRQSFGIGPSDFIIF
jgi:hypothetical protein